MKWREEAKVNEDGKGHESHIYVCIYTHIYE